MAGLKIRVVPINSMNLVSGNNVRYLIYTKQFRRCRFSEVLQLAWFRS